MEIKIGRIGTEFNLLSSHPNLYVIVEIEDDAAGIRWIVNENVNENARKDRISYHHKNAFQNDVFLGEATDIERLLWAV